MHIDPHHRLDATPDHHATALRAVADGATAWRIVVWDMHDGEFVIHLEDYVRRGDWEIFWEDLIAGADGAARLANDFARCETIPAHLRTELQRHPMHARHITAPGCDTWIRGFSWTDGSDVGHMAASSLAEVLFFAT